MAWCDAVEPRTLRECRIALGQSQAAFAAMLGVSPESYRTWDAGCLRRSLLIGSLQLCGRDGNDRSRAPVHLSNERDRRGGVRHARVRQPWKAGPQPRGLRLVRHEVRSTAAVPLHRLQGHAEYEHGDRVQVLAPVTVDR